MDIDHPARDVMTIDLLGTGVNASRLVTVLFWAMVRHRRDLVVAMDRSGTVWVATARVISGDLL
jgi:hypothetical protein